MAHSESSIDVYLEIGKKKTFACAVDWPGWCRSGRDETGALQALFDAGPRYGRVLHSARLGFQTPLDVSAFVVVERLVGNATTDMGTPSLVPAIDARPVDDADLRRLQSILGTCWQVLDATVESAQGKTLRTGSRGGGRALDGIIEHVRGGEAGYCTSLGGKIPSTATNEEARQIVLDTLIASAHGKIAAFGPRGGKRWPPCYFVRRAAWHVLDHAWEIEDRSE